MAPLGPAPITATRLIETVICIQEMVKNQRVCRKVDIAKSVMLQARHKLKECTTLVDVISLSSI